MKLTGKIPVIFQIELFVYVFIHEFKLYLLLLFVKIIWHFCEVFGVTLKSVKQFKYFIQISDFDSEGQSFIILLVYGENI